MKIVKTYVDLSSPFRVCLCGMVVVDEAVFEWKEW